jgi:hypothetical protein
MTANMAYRWRDGVLYAPAGFRILDRTGDHLDAWHIKSRKTARVAGVFIECDGSADAVQRELDRACAKLLIELERESSA